MNQEKCEISVAEQIEPTPEGVGQNQYMVNEDGSVIHVNSYACGPENPENPVG